MAIAGPARSPKSRWGRGIPRSGRWGKDPRHDTFLDVKHSELREVLHGAWTGVGNLKT